MQATASELDVAVRQTLRAAAIPGEAVQIPHGVAEFGGVPFVEVILTDASYQPLAEAALGERFKSEDVSVSVRSVWRIEEIGEPQIAYGPNGSPRAAVLISVKLKSGATESEVTVAVTKLAEMEFERILGGKLNLKEVAKIVISNALKLGGTSSWDPRKRDYFEVASNSVADLSRGLRRTA